MGRIIIFTGKGGVGKTSTAAAHGVKAAQTGLKTLIVSTDMAHNLSDIFMTKIKEETVKVMDNLYALEIDPNYEMDKYYNSISTAFKNMLPNIQEEDNESLEDMVVFPGIEELFSLIRIKELYEKNIYDLIIVDCAPTGETLSLLKFPELLSWYMEKFFPIGKVALKVLRPISKAVFKIDMPDKKAMNDIEKLYINLIRLQELLKDREICSIRLVTIPEKMVVEETKRNYMYLNLYNFNVDGLYINRIIPEEVDNSFFTEWKSVQKLHLEELKSVFIDIPNFQIKWYESDINGLEGLNRIVIDSLQREDIFKVLKTTQNESFIKLEQGYLLEISIPFANKTDFDLYQSDTEVIIKIRNFKRNIPLPDVIRKYSIASAKLQDEKLSIIFQ
ncbi:MULTISPECIES: ArsA family ATPase [Clostridium]|uniref:arsenite-transporting ATPase n=1 Tax=Clostridium sporogenes TaxID=1509 RepID=A0A7X5PAZ4_CLOSG|nr:ArsA family ATPase [Clostridium sporogenes]AJD30971.1 transport-energizing ATPase, TRC40/GET3/ArsA family protein [Clostridium botulinum Prevot_594]KRU44879.1 anion-transporting ATPase [Clostridium sporogenes]KYN76715.1 arsenic-transporting ATPase [Clostridium sporogenes]MBW5459075.1 TRC40/GET3/ArsA family transport-energizing ATPase [Clostridium sporogenes]MBY7014622.1 ArsA family ATPase [Clostridium sporogenes]